MIIFIKKRKKEPMEYVTNHTSIGSATKRLALIVLLLIDF